MPRPTHFPFGFALCLVGPLCTPLPSTAVAQIVTPSQTTSARLDAVVEPYLAAKTFMGVVLVASGDKVLLNKGYGFADVEWSISNTPD